MKKISIVCFCNLFFVIFNYGSSNLDCSIVPCNSVSSFRCEISNENSFCIEMPGYFMINDNTIVYKTSLLEDEINIGSDVDWGVMPTSEILQPDQKKIEFASRKCIKRLSSQYGMSKWIICIQTNIWQTAKPFGFGVLKDTLESPKANIFEEDFPVNLAYVFNATDCRRDEISFIYANHGATSNSVFAPYSEVSRIIVESSSFVSTNSLGALNYGGTNDLQKTVAPGECVGWRFLWRDVTNSLPHDVWLSIKNAGHVKLRWKCGDVISEPLPLWLKEE